MGQLLALAVPMTDPIHPDDEDHNNEDHYHHHHNQDGDDQQSEHNGGMGSSVMSNSHFTAGTHHTPREYSESMMNMTAMGHSFNDSMLSASVSLPSIARAKMVKKILDGFDTYEFLVDTAVEGVLSYNLGYPGDAHEQLRKIKRKIEADPVKYRNTLTVEFEEEYHRGLITNAFYTCDQIVKMAESEILPSLLDLGHMDKREVRMWLQEHSGGAFVDLKDLVPKRSTKRVTTTYISSTALIGNHRRTASQALTAQYSPQRGSMNGSAADMPSAFDGAEEPQTPAASPSVDDPGVVTQFKSLTGRGIDVSKFKCECQLTDAWMMLKEEAGSTERLNSGHGYFKFMSRSLSECSKEDLDSIRPFVNLSNFKDEVIENNVPHVDIYNPEQQLLYIALVVKALYILPGIRYTDLCDQMMTDLDYQKNCQPGDCKFFDCDAPNTFRQNKTIIKFVYTVLIQMRAGMISDPEELKQFATVEGITPSRVIVLERTKRNIQKSDSTAKCKSVLLYYQLDGGVLLNHTTVVLNTNVPTIVAKVVNNFGGQGAKEAAETANLTRKYLLKRFGDSRTQ